MANQSDKLDFSQPDNALSQIAEEQRKNFSQEMTLNLLTHIRLFILMQLQMVIRLVEELEVN